MFRRALIVSAALWFLSSSPAWAGPIYADVFFFGTSELDTGNWLLDPALSGDPVAPTAAKGYWNGRWQEGPAWSDYFAAGLGHDATASLAGGQNYAYGLAWLGPLPGDPVPVPGSYAAKTQLYFGSQITAALVDYANALPSDALYVVTIGSNDPGPFYNKPVSEADDRANVAVSEIQRLVDAGATNFLVQTLGGTDAYVLTYNQTLLAGLAGISGIKVAIVDTRTFNQTVVLAPGFLAGLGINDFGRCNLDPVCLAAAQASAGLGVPYLGNTHLLFDTVHRNTKVAEALADYALAQVPEPGTMSLLTVGLGAALVWGRKRLGRSVRAN